MILVLECELFMGFDLKIYIYIPQCREDSVDKSFLVNKSWNIVDLPGYG